MRAARLALSGGPVIFVRSGGLGDFILSLPLLRALAAGTPSLCVVTRPAYFCLLPDGVRPKLLFSVDSARALPFFDPGTIPDRELLELFHGASIFLFGAPDAAQERRFRSLGAAGVVWLEPRPARPPHAAARYLAAAGVPAPRGLLETPPLYTADKVVGNGLWMHPGSGGQGKNLPPELFAEFANIWRRERPGTPVCISFGEADGPLIAPARVAFASRGLRPDWLVFPELPILVARLREQTGLFVGNDSGVSHLAAALGLPTLAMFRITDPAIWRPLGNCLAVKLPVTGDPATDAAGLWAECNATIAGMACQNQQMSS